MMMMTPTAPPPQGEHTDMMIAHIINTHTHKSFKHCQRYCEKDLLRERAGHGNARSRDSDLSLGDTFKKYELALVNGGGFVCQVQSGKLFFSLQNGSRRSAVLNNGKSVM